MFHHQFFCREMAGIDQGHVELFCQTSVMIFNIARHQDIGPLAMSRMQKACTTAAAKSDFMDLPAPVTDQAEMVAAESLLDPCRIIVKGRLSLKPADTPQPGTRDLVLQRHEIVGDLFVRMGLLQFFQCTSQPVLGNDCFKANFLGLFSLTDLTSKRAGPGTGTKGSLTPAAE